MIDLLIKILITVLFIATVGIFSVDYYFYLVDRYCRFHIGRWKNDTSWENNVYKVALKWSKKTPTVRVTDGTRYILLDMIHGKYRSQSIQSWQNAAIILGLSDKGEYSSAMQSASQFIDNTGNWKKSPVAIDSSMLAYAILKTAKDPQFVKPAMDFMISLISRNIDEQGLITYTNQLDDPARYVDTLGLVCPFLALYARVYCQPQYETLAYEQLKFYHTHGLLADTNLPNHAVDCITQLPLGVYGWGRGVAWYVIGLLDTYTELATENYRKDVKSWIIDAAKCYLSFQHNDGGFGSIFQVETTYDSSATAALAWFYAECALLFDYKEYSHCASLCLKKIKSVTRITGKVDWCQGDTKGIGVFSQIYSTMPFAQGMTLRAIETLRKAKLNDKKNSN